MNFRRIVHAVALSGTLILGGVILISPSCRRSSGPSLQTLNIWHTEVDDNAKRVMDEIAREFEKSHPNVKVEQQAVSWGTLAEKLQTALAAGDVPDLTHLEPFMTASLYRKGLLLPMDEIFDHVGVEDVFPAVRDLQKFDEHRYGIAYAVGITFFAVRTDLLAAEGITSIKNWADFVNAARKLTTERRADGSRERFGITLPGTPFFIDQFSAELVASNGGRLYDDQGRPTFTEQPVLEMLTFWRDVSAFAPGSWTSQSYLDQFKEFANGKVAMVPVFYGRALKNIENDAGEIGNAKTFGFIEQPSGPSGTEGTATMDCENWSILKGAKHPDLAMEFLKYFYRKDLYLRYCQSVPIHLTPVLRSVAASKEYMGTPFVQRWSAWQERTNEMLQSGKALPILFARPGDRMVDYLMELNGQRVITDMVLGVCGGKSPAEVAAEGQKKAEELWRQGR